MAGHDQLELDVAYHGGQIINLTPDADWVSLRKIEIPSKNIGYDYAHEEKSRGHIIAVLPFRVSYVSGNREYLIRSEVIPPWGLAPQTCAVTGSWDKEGETFDEVAVREMLEETGFTVTLGELIDLGTCRGTKALDTVYHLYAVDTSGKIPEEPTGDGSEMEALAGMLWVESLVDVEDPLVPTMFLRLQSKG